MEELVTIAAFGNSAEAAIFKGFLEANSISCFLKDENLVTMRPDIASAIGFIKLQVFRSDAERAASLISEYQKVDIQDAEHIPDTGKCSRCGSERTEHVKPEGLKVFFSAPVLFVPLIISGKNWRCRNCGKRWKVPVTRNGILLSVLLFTSAVIIWYTLYYLITSDYFS